MSHFRFFDLPRELRDVVYELLVLPSKEIYSGVDEQDTKVITTNVPDSAVLRAHKQLNAEYSDRLPASRRIHVWGGHCDHWTGYPNVAGSLARSVDECYVYIHIDDYCDNLTETEYIERNLSPVQCDAVDFLYDYGEALREFLRQFPDLNSVHLRIGLGGSDDVPLEILWTLMSEKAPPCLSHSNGFPVALDTLVALPLEVQDLEVVRLSTDEQYQGYCNDEEHGLPSYFTWTRTAGWKAGPLVLARD